jgi:oligosaccharide translocation protein RFT1
LLSIGFLLVMILFHTFIASTTGSHKLSSILYCVAAMIEAFAEPWFILSHVTLSTGQRIKAEASAVLLKSAITYLGVAVFALQAVGFGIGQLAYSLTYTYVIIICAPKLSDGYTYFVHRLHSGHTSTAVAGVLTVEDASNVLALTAQSVVKHALTEADKIVLTWTSDDFNSGVYALANNYGSLAARLVFQPIEEMSRVLFARIVADQSPLRSGHVLDVFYTIMRFLWLIGLLVACFGPNYSRVLLKVLQGRKWYSDEAVYTLSVYCVYVLAIALNGISEAFVFSVLARHLVKYVNLGLVASCLVFAVLVNPLMRYVL